jgi:hypothetical protein
VQLYFEFDRSTVARAFPDFHCHTPFTLTIHIANFATAASSHSMPWPGLSGTMRLPSLISKGSDSIGSAQSCVCE